MHGTDYSKLRTCVYIHIFQLLLAHYKHKIFILQSCELSVGLDNFSLSSGSCCLIKWVPGVLHRRKIPPHGVGQYSYSPRTVRGSNPGGGEIFRTFPDRPWGPPSLLHNVQGGSNMTGTNCDLFTHNQSRSYLNHLVHRVIPGGIAAEAWY